MSDFSQVDKRLTKFGDFLRKSKQVKLIGGVVNDRRVEVFKGENMVEVLLSDKATKATKEKLTSPVEAQKILKLLLNEGFFLKVDRVPNTKNRLQPSNSRAWDDAAFYAWVYEGSQLMNMMYALGLVLIAFVFVMYPMWPSSLRSLSWYVFMAGMGFMGFIFILGIIRLIVFSVTMFTHIPGLWIFPNLFADCGFFESFVPLYAWHVPAPSEKDE